jgi:hypothetical protein
MCIAMTSVKGSKQWYESGVAYFLNYKDDKKTARKKKRGVKTEVFILTTKPEGHRYGLQKIKLLL